MGYFLAGVPLCSKSEVTELHTRPCVCLHENLLPEHLSHRIPWDPGAVSSHAIRWWWRKQDRHNLQSLKPEKSENSLNFSQGKIFFAVCAQRNEKWLWEGDPICEGLLGKGERPRKPLGEDREHTNLSLGAEESQGVKICRFLSLVKIWGGRWEGVGGSTGGR